MRSVLKWTVGAAVVGMAAAFGGLALAADEDPADRYRLATASVGDVTQTVPTNGTVDFVNRADVSFAIGGTLAGLSVAQGDRVKVGQRLGTLDAAGLRADVNAAASELASAKATLEADQQAQEEAAADSDPDSDTDSDTDTERPDRLARQQRAVREAQTAASKAITAAKAALAAQRSACAEPTSTTCADALAAATAAQDGVARAQDALQQRIAELAAAMAESESEVDMPADEPAPTAATIAADQAAVDTAEAELLAAKRALARATLTAPIAGTVASVQAAAGDDVTAGTAVLVLIGEGAAVVETTVPVERISSIEVGQAATVTPSGSRTGVPGTVSRIGRLADDSADSADSVAYPVTITVEDPPATMPAGSTAGVAIVVATAEDVLTVPTSAVSDGMVTVLEGTAASPRQVTVGTVGPLRTEIADGLVAGERVVLADLELPLPSGDEQTGPGPGGDVVFGPRMGGPAVRMGG